MKKYELSLTRDYVSDWGVLEAVRELIQNARDEGNAIIEFDDNDIVITNENISIPSSTLALGSSTKRDDINKVGCYGEGFKLAVLVLLREGYDVAIFNGNKTWHPSFQYSELFNTEVLCIEEEETYGDDLTFAITNIPSSLVEELKSQFVGIGDESYSCIETKYGEILTDEEYKGKMFVNGLPIMEDDGFDFGYNFKPEYVSLDRDRKSINLRELYEITSLAVVNMTSLDYDFIDDIIDGHSDDGRSLRDKDIIYPNEFVRDYGKHLRERFGVDDDTIIVNKESKDTIEELKRRQQEDDSIKFVETPKSIYADILNRNNEYSSGIINDIHNEINKKSNIERSWHEYKYSTYKRLIDWFDEHCADMNDSAKDDYMDIIEEFEPYGFDLIRGEI